MKKSPEPIILAVALVLLAATAAGLALTFPSVTDITQVSSLTPAGKVPPKIKEEDLKASLVDWTAPAVWTTPESKHRLFISNGFLFYASVYPNGDYLKKFDEKTRTPSGVLISWYQKYGLDFTDPGIDREDPDGDGFSNIVEFRNESPTTSDADGTKSTNPLDPQSHPSYLSRLRLQKYDSRPFHIQFRGYQMLDGVYNFQIYLKDEPSYNQPRLKKTGDKLGFEDYIVGPFHLITVQKEDPATHLTSTVDVSTLELDKPDIGFKIVLTYRQEIDSPESTANFIMLMPTEVDKVTKVERGKTFTPPFMAGTTFLLIEAKADGAIIRNQETKQEIHVPLLDPKEWDEVPVPSPATPTTPAKQP